MIRSARWVSTYLQKQVYTKQPLGRCPLCLAPAHRGHLCLPCTSGLPRHDACCTTCAAPLPVMAPACGRCLQLPPAFDTTVAALPYAFPIDAMIGRFKFQGEQAMARPLIALLAQRLQLMGQPEPDLLVPCPIHPSRYRARGFNQAAIIAAELGRVLRIRVDYRLCKRTIATPAQTGLDRAARLKNLHRAFAVTRAAPPHVALIDDVMTTGATAQQLATLLKARGAERVSVWTLARTPLK